MLFLLYVKIGLVIQASTVAEAPKAPTLRQGFSLSTADFWQMQHEGDFLWK